MATLMYPVSGRMYNIDSHPLLDHAFKFAEDLTVPSPLTLIYGINRRCIYEVMELTHPSPDRAMALIRTEPGSTSSK